MPYADPEVDRQYHLRYAKLHPESRRRYALAHREEYRAYKKEDYRKNKTRYAEYQKKWRLAHPVQNALLQKFRHIKHKYNLTKEQWLAQVEKQQRLCAICSSDMKDKICTDHSHKTNKFRGLLCDNCNVGLGKFKDSVALLKCAIDYINLL